MKKSSFSRFISFLVCVALMFGSVSFVFADEPLLGTAAPVTATAKPTFSDMRAESFWSYKALNFAVENKIMQGSAGLLNPAGKLTRAEMATIINNVFGMSEEADISAFKDVKTTDWFYGQMAKSVQGKIFNGSTDGTLNPKGQITRQDAFLVLARALKLDSENTDSLNSFSDASKVANYAKSGLAAMVSAGYVNGSNGQLNPQGLITREEIAQVFYNVFKEIVSEAKTVTGDKTGTVIANAPGVTVKNATIDGDIIVGDGVGDGEFTLDNVKLTGRLLVRGGGANSIKIVNGSSVGNVIVSKTESGSVRVYCEKGALVNVIRVDDGKDDIKIEGSFVSVEVQTDKQVNLANADVAKLSINAANANVNIESGSVAEVTVAESAVAAAISTGKDSTVGLMVINADVKVEAAGTIQKTEAAENVTVSGNVEAKAEEKPSGGGGGGGGGGGTDPTPDSTTAVVKNEQQLNDAITKEKIKTIAIAESFELDDQIRFGGDTKEIIVNSGVCITVPGISVGTNAKFTNKGTINFKAGTMGNPFCEVYNTSIKFVNEGTMNFSSGYLYVQYGATFECNGKLVFKNYAFADILGTLTGTGTFVGNDGDIRAYNDAVVNWPTNVNIQEVQEYADFFREGWTSIHTQQQVTFGSNVKHDLPVETTHFANIYGAGGYTEFEKVLDSASKYEVIRFYRSDKITITTDVAVRELCVWDAADVEIAEGVTVSADYLQIAYAEDDYGNFVSPSSLTNKGTLVLGESGDNRVDYVNFRCKLINDGTLEQKSGCIRIAEEAVFENNGTFIESATPDSARVQVFGTITGAGTFTGPENIFDGSFCAYPGAKVYWPKAVTYSAFYNYIDEYYGKKTEDNYFESNNQKSITFGSEIKHSDQAECISAHIYSQDGYQAFENAIKSGKTYDYVGIHCNLTIETSISVDLLQLYSGSKVTIKQNNTVVTANSIYIYEGSVLTNKGNLVIGDGSSGGYIEVGHGNTEGTLNNEAGATITLNKVSRFSVSQYSTFVCDGTLNSDADSWMTVSGTISGTGTFNGGASISVRGGAVVNWPTNVKFEFNGGDDSFYGATDSRSRVGSASVKYGPNIPSGNKADASRDAYAYIYNQEGLAQYLDVTSKASIYDRVFFYDCSDITINSVIDADRIFFNRSKITIGASGKLNAEDGIYVREGSIVTNAGTVIAGSLMVDDWYNFDYEGDNHVYTEGAFTAFINENAVTLQSEYSNTLDIRGSNAYVEHKFGKFSIQGGVRLGFGAKLKINTPATNIATGTDLFSVVSGNENDIYLRSYSLDGKNLISSVEFEKTNDLRVRNEITIYDASKLDTVKSVYDIVYIEDELIITDDTTITQVIQVDKLTVKEGKKLTLSTGNDYTNGIINIVVETDASLVIATDTNLNIGNQYYDDRTDSITGECGYVNYGTIVNNGWAYIRSAYKYGDPKPIINYGNVEGNPFSTASNVYVSNKVELIEALKDDDVVNARIYYYGSLQINPEDNFPVVEKPILFSNSNGNSDVKIVIATNASFVVSGSGMNYTNEVHFPAGDGKTIIYGTLKTVNDASVVIYDTEVNGSIENEGSLFVTGDMVLNGSLINKHSDSHSSGWITVQYNSTINSYGTITNEEDARILCGRPEYYGGNNPSKGNVIIYEGTFTNDGVIRIINGSSVIVNKLNDSTTFTNNGTINTNTQYNGDTYSTGNLTINEGVAFTGTGTIDEAHGLVFTDNSK